MLRPDLAHMVGDMYVTGRIGNLHERMSARPSHESHAGPGPDEFYRGAAAALGNQESAEIAPGVRAYRTAEGGIALSTNNLRERMAFEANAPAAPPVATPDFMYQPPAESLSARIDRLIARTKEQP